MWAKHCLKLIHPLITPEHLTHHVIVYIRQSSDHQVEVNKGSTEYQRAQVEVALAYGWQKDQIILIDDDLGRSGTGVDHRPGYKRMLDLVASGKVKAIIATDTSRLSRNLPDLIQLLALAARQAAVLILDRRPVNPQDHADIFVSRILGIVAEFENRLRTQTMVRARLTKAKKGEIVMPLPIGLTKLNDGTVIKNPEVKDTIELVIRTFWESRSLLGTVRSLRAKGIKLPSKRKAGKFQWKEATTDKVRSILLNPAYAGIYAYGRSEIVASDPERLPTKYPIRRPLPEERWIKFYNRLPAYMSLEAQGEIKNILRSNSFSKKDRPGKGSALLQGIIVCGKCGSKLTVSYGGGTTCRTGIPVPMDG